MANKINVEGGNPFRDSRGRFDDSPFDFLQNRGSKTYVSREDNEKKVKALKTEADKQLKLMRKAAENKDSLQAKKEYDEAEHQKRVASAADAIANLDGTEEAVATGQVDQLEAILEQEELVYTRSEIQDAIMTLHQDPYYQQFVLPNYPGANPQQDMLDESERAKEGAAFVQGTNRQKIDQLLSEVAELRKEKRFLANEGETDEADALQAQIDEMDEAIDRLSMGADAKDKDGNGENKNVPILDSVNPTGGLFVDYNPQLIASAQLADNMTTLDQTTGGSPDDIITVYRGVDKEFNQTEIVPGDFITDMKELAESYTGDGNVIELRVRKGDVVDDANEPGGNEYLYIPGAEKKVAGAGAAETKAEDTPKETATRSSKAQKVLDDIENKIRSLPKEKFYAVGKNGEVIGEADGNKDQVNIDFTTAAKIAVDGEAVLTHNHPTQKMKGGESSTLPFSLDDLITVSMVNAKTMRAVGETHDFEIERTDKWPAPSMMRSTHEQSLKNSEKTLREKLAKGEITDKEFQFERHNLALLETSKALGFRYTATAYSVDETQNEQSKKPKTAPVTANALNHKIDLVVKNQISARDFPHVYEDLGINLGDLGCIMMDVEPIDIMESIQDLYDSANIYYGEPDDTHYGIPAMNEAHVTLLYGLLQNGHVWRDKVNEMLMGWTLPELTVEKVSYFDIGKAFAVIALLKKTPELIDGHERLTLLPHVNTFSEYIPHVSLVYVDKTVDVDALVKTLNKKLKGATLVTKGINYGDEPEHDDDDYDEPEQTSDSKAVEADEVAQTDSLVEYREVALQSPENEGTEGFLAHQGHEHNHSHELDKFNNSLTEDQANIQLLEQANLDEAVKNLDQDVINAVIEQLQRGNIRAAEELITEVQEGVFVNALVTALVVYGLAMLPLYAMQLLFMRTNGAGIWDSSATDPADPDYEFSDDLKNATRASAQSHVRTILKDTTRVINDAYDDETEKQLQKLIDERLAAQDEGYDREALYKIARTKAKKGESLQNIIKAVEAASNDISTNRAKVLSRNEQFRIFTMSQFEADRQFLNQTGNKKRAYKRLVSMSGNPCPICNLIIKRTAISPIPFTKNFANLHDELETEYTKANGDAGRMKLKLNFAPIESGNVHVQCHCRYELLLKNDDGSFLNAIEGDQYTLKATNSIDFDPTLHPRDKDGKFKTKVGKYMEDVYKSYPSLQSDAKLVAKLLQGKAKAKKVVSGIETGSDEWWDAYETLGKAEKAYNTQLNKSIDNMGIDIEEVNGLNYEWSGGNGPRGEDGYYISTPELQENVQNSNILKAQYLTQAALYELGLEKVSVYRGEKATVKHEARGLVSFSTSKAAAETFGWTTKYEIEKNPSTGKEVKVPVSVPGNLIEKQVPITAVLSHHFILFDTEYETEREVIVDTDKL